MFRSATPGRRRVTLALAGCLVGRRAKPVWESERGCPQLTPLEDKAGTTICSTSSARVSGRTGTNSLQLALERLGFGPCYHMLEVIRQRDSTARWEHGLSAGPVDWDRGLRRIPVDRGLAGLRVLAVAGGSVPGGQGGADRYATRDRGMPAPKGRFSPPRRWSRTGDATELDEETLRFVSFMTGELLPAMLDDGRGGRLDELDEERAIQTSSGTTKRSGQVSRPIGCSSTTSPTVGRRCASSSTSRCGRGFPVRQRFRQLPAHLPDRVRRSDSV